MSYRVPMMPFPNGPNFGRVPDQLTTVYVGKIPPAVDDDFIRKLLEVLEKVSSSDDFSEMRKSSTVEKSE